MHDAPEQTFSPALWLQRRAMVLKILLDFGVTSVFDVGCGEGSLLQVLAGGTFTRVAGLDVDPVALMQTVKDLEPNAYSHRYLRDSPCQIDVYQGSLAEPDPRLLGYQAITCTEVVEHLFPPALECFPKIVFGYYKPMLVIVTTPNSEFNGLFTQMKPGDLRHWDHKFEWTRNEFQAWGNQIALQFNYTVRFSGVGTLPHQGPLHILGHCTQFAIFVRNEHLVQEPEDGTLLLQAQESNWSLSPTDVPPSFALVSNIELPFFQFDEFEDSQLITEVKDQLRYLSFEIPSEDVAEEPNDNTMIYDQEPEEPLASMTIHFIFEMGRLWDKLRIRQVCKTRKNLERILLLGQALSKGTVFRRVTPQEHYPGIPVLDSDDGERSDSEKSWIDLARIVNPHVSITRQYWMINYEWNDPERELGIDNLRMDEYEEEEDIYYYCTFLLPGKLDRGVSGREKKMSDTSSTQEEFKDEPTLGVYEGGRNEQKQRHGQGKNIFPNGDIYEGEYSEGKRHGQGTYKWKATGARYVGSFANNLKHGHGELVYPDGSRYSGAFENGKRHGTGIHRYANGDTYEGGWADDLKHGTGVYTFKTSGSKKKGIWDKGSLTGMGEIIHADHKIYGKFLTNDHMEMPAKQTFHATGNYARYVTDHLVLEQEPFVPAPPAI